jgi:hypothetical protein
MRPRSVFGLCLTGLLNRFKRDVSHRQRRMQPPHVEGGLYLDREPAGTQIVVQTANRQYLLETCEGCEAILSGHPDYCPEPIHVRLYGSSAETAKVLPGFIGQGQCLLLLHPSGRYIRTSPVRQVRKLTSLLKVSRASYIPSERDSLSN